ncbi:MAG TPA: RagB/SusD family nutrient uptake outer membrane protein, partial [Flavisolibacter sp.]|nr:RagB/SusD family nutrient uptake outer membrane protein [Flavisolibacter sp.]
MKRKIFPSILVLVLFVSCSKNIDQVPISDATVLTFYAQPSDFVQAANAIYNDLRGYPDRQLNLSETRSDNLYAVSDGGVRDWEGINSFHKTISANPYISEAWSSDYNGIFRANTLLEQLQKNGSVITDVSLRARLEAEAKFLRAFFYFDLVRLFGKVPLIDHTVTAEEAQKIQRSAVADVYKLIISDLEFAGTNLPETYTAGNDKG